MKKTIASALMTILLISTTPTSYAKISNPEIKTSVVQIWNEESDGNFYTGSGVTISSDAMILSAAHVIIDKTTGKPSEKLYICITKSEYSAPECQYSGAILAFNEEIDLAVIYPAYKINKDLQKEGKVISIEEAQAIGLPYIDIADYEPELGDDITILGYPQSTGSENLTLTNGVISNFQTLNGYNYYYVTDATINPGNSGGPVYNSDEKLIGIVRMVSTEGLGGNYGYVIAGDMIYLWFQDLKNQGILTENYVDNLFSNDFNQQNFTDTSFSELQSQIENNTTENLNIFSDVQENNKNFTAISYLKSNNIISGYDDGSFKPENPINRAELLKILVEGAGYTPEASQYSNCFPDVKNDWYAKYVCFAKDKGWIEGYEDNTFKPSNNINKAEAIKMMLETFEVELKIPEDQPFKDVNLNSWYGKYVNTAKVGGLLEETDEYFPDASISRAQISENLYRLIRSKEKAKFISDSKTTVCSLLKMVKENPKVSFKELNETDLKMTADFGYEQSQIELEEQYAEYIYSPEYLDAMEKVIPECGDENSYAKLKEIYFDKL